MKTISIRVPETLDIDDMQLSMFVASRFYEQGKLSLGQAAEIAGLSKRTFVELLGLYNVSVFNYPVSDLSRDAAYA